MWRDSTSSGERDQTQKDTCVMVVLRRQSRMEIEKVCEVEALLLPHFVLAAMARSV